MTLVTKKHKKISVVVIMKLIPFNVEHIDTLLNWVRQEKDQERFLLQWSGPIFKHPLTYNQLADRILIAEKQPKTLYLFSAIDEADSKMVGYVELSNFNELAGGQKNAQLSRVIIGPNLRSKGYGQKMLNGVLGIAFLELKLDYVDLFVFDFNKTAIYCYQKNGFELTSGRAPERHFHDETWNLFIMRLDNVKWSLIINLKERKAEKKGETLIPTA